MTPDLHTPSAPQDPATLHTPVLLAEVLAALVPGGVAPLRLIDGTLGMGGHSLALLDAGARALLGLDQDAQALALARTRLAAYAERVAFVHTNFDALARVAAQHGWADGADAILLDLGVSSLHLDAPARGFSFRHDGPLDMRMNPDLGEATAADLVNTLDERALAHMFFTYGEERHARALARAIVAGRPFHTTGALAAHIQQHKPAQWKERIHPATRVFQALRIAVNDELGALERVLPQAIALLRPGGRLAIISFHSLEDRLVKQAFRQASAACTCPPQQPICTCGGQARFTALTRKPTEATDAEAAANPRSRSAKLRVLARPAPQEAAS